MSVARLYAALGLAVAMMAAARPAMAQVDVPSVKPFEAVDARGVNLATGAFTVDLGTVSVGDGPGRMSDSVSYTGGDGDYRHTIAGGISKDSAGASLPQLFTVTVPGAVNTFARTTSGTYVRRNGPGGTLVKSGATYTFTYRDGAVALFSTAIRGGAGFMGGEALLTSITYPGGEVWTYHYTGTPSRLQSVTNNYGYQIHFRYETASTTVEAINNAVDRCSPTANACPTFTRTWPSLTFTASGGVRSITDALARTTRIMESSARISGVARPTKTTGQNLTIAYDALGLVKTVNDGQGTWTYAIGQPMWEYLPQNTTTTVTDPLNRTTSIEVNWFSKDDIDGNGIIISRIPSTTDPLGNTTTFNYDTYGRTTRVINPEGDEIAISYGPNGLPSSRTHTPKAGSGLSPTNVHLSFDDCSTPILCLRPTSYTDARGNVTDYTYDAAGNLLTETGPAPTAGAARPQTRYAWQQKYAWYRQNGSSSITQAATPVWVQVGVSACVTGISCAGAATEMATTTAYQAGSASAASNLLPTTVSSGSGNGSLTATTATTYDAVGNVLTVNGPLSGTADTTRYVWDAMRQPVGVIGPDPDGAGARLFPATRTTYNADGQVVSVEQGTTTGQTDAAWSAFSALRTDTTAYDAQGRRARDTTASGAAAAMVTQYSYDAASNLLCTAQRMNPSVYASLPASACTLGTEGTFGKDRITRNTYDNADRLLTVTTGYGVTPITESQTWTANGKVATRTDGAGHVSTYVYDGFDRVSRLRFPNPTGSGSSTTDYENWTYDAAGNVTQFRNRGGDTISYTWDALNRKTLTSAPSGTANRAYAYDNLGRLLTVTGGTPSQTLTSTWDALSRLTGETGLVGTVAYQYDLAGRRTRITWPGSPALYVQYDYNLDDGVSAIRENGATSGAGVLATYAYDNLGRRTGITRGNGVTTTYGYDAASRLTSLAHNPTGTAQDVTFGFTFNPASQILGRTVSNAIYNFTPATGTTSYVNNGRNQVTSAGGASVTYDARQNITAVAGGSHGYDAYNQMTAANRGTAATLDYDPAGRLYRITGPVHIRYLYDGGRIIGEASSAGAVQARYVPGPGTDETVAAYGTDLASRAWPLQDERGSVIASASGTGAATGINTYDEYGQPASGNAGRFQYTGQAWMPEAGAYYYKARFYQPGIGRFFQTDPIGYEAGLNLYAYVGNDPVNATDPTGMCPQCVIACAASPACRGAIGGAFGGTVAAVTQVAQNGFPTNSQQWTDLAIATAAGAVDGALVANGVNPAVAGAVSGAGQSLATDAAHGQLSSGEAVAGSLGRAAASSAAGAAGGRLGQTVGRQAGNLAVDVTVGATRSIPYGAVAGLTADEVAGATTGSIVAAAAARPTSAAGNASGGAYARGAATLSDLERQAIAYESCMRRRGNQC